MKKWFINSGVQVNHSMVNPLDFVVDSCAIQEFRAFPYANAQECRNTLIKAYNKYVRGAEEQNTEKETNNERGSSV